MAHYSAACYDFYDSPWNPVGPVTRNGQQAVQIVHNLGLADAVGSTEAVELNNTVGFNTVGFNTVRFNNTVGFNDTVGLGSSSNNSADSSPRELGMDAAFHQGLDYQFSKLNDPAYLPLGRSEYQTTDCEYSNVNTANARPGSEGGISGNSRRHHSQSPRLKPRCHPYLRPTYPQSEFDAEDAASMHSQSESPYIAEPYHGQSDYGYGNGSVNLQQLEVSNSQYWPYASTNVETSLTPFHASTTPYYENNAQASYLSSNIDGAPTSGNSSDEDNDAAVAQSVKNDLKRGALKKSNSKKGKKHSAKGSIKGVQKSGEGKPDKGVKGKKSKDRLRCTYSPCSSKIYNNASELRKHMQVKHIRPFKCTFSFAGCDQIFGSKNEWKRHVTSQHMYLSYWKCNLSLCKDRQAFFNRRDLMGQHLKRMHAPHAKKIESFMSEAEKNAVQEQNQAKLEWWIRDEIPNIQDRCFTTLRETPLESNCEICDTKFSGPKSWDTKMEHVGKHYETGEQLTVAPFMDRGLIQWALDEGLVVERDPYESSSNTSESGYLEHFSGPSSSAQEALTENNCKYQFTKSNQFVSKSIYSDQSLNRKPDNLPLRNRDLDSHTDDNNHIAMHDNALFDGAFNDEAPSNHDTRLLLFGGSLMIS